MKQTFISHSSSALGAGVLNAAELSGMKSGANLKIDGSTINPATEGSAILQILQGTGNVKAPRLISDFFKAKEIVAASYETHKSPIGQEIALVSGASDILVAASPLVDDIYSLTLIDVTPGEFQLDHYPVEVVGSYASDATLITALSAAVNNPAGKIAKDDFATAISGVVLKLGASIANVACNVNNLVATHGSATVTQTSTTFAAGDVFIDSPTGATYVLTAKATNSFTLDRPFSGETVTISGSSHPIRIAAANVAANTTAALIITIADTKTARVSLSEELDGESVTYVQNFSPGLGTYAQVSADEAEAESYGRGVTNKVQFTNKNPRYANSGKVYDFATIKYTQSFESKSGMKYGYNTTKFINIWVENGSSASTEVSAFIADVKTAAGL